MLSSSVMSIATGDPRTPPRPYVLGKSEPPVRLIMGPAVSMVIVTSADSAAKAVQLASRRRDMASGG